MKKKICSKCGVEKKLTEFYKRSKSKDGHSASCKICYRDKTKKKSMSKERIDYLINSLTPKDY